MESIGEKIGFIALILTTLSLGTSPHPFILILCYGIHELGHLIFSYVAGADMKGFKIGSLRLRLFYSCENLSYKRELLVQSGGIIFNLISALIVSFLPIFRGDVADFFKICSISLALFNLYPVSVLDGGGMLKSLLCILCSNLNVQRVCDIVSFLCAVIMWLISVYLQLVFNSNISLFIISVFLLMELCFSYKYN